MSAGSPPTARSNRQPPRSSARVDVSASPTWSTISAAVLASSTTRRRSSHSGGSAADPIVVIRTPGGVRDRIQSSIEEPARCSEDTTMTPSV